jgi:hypothetical protein
MSKLILLFLAAVSAIPLHAMMPVGALPVMAQAPSERDQIVALIEKLGGKARLDEHKPERPVVAVDI